MHSIGVLESNAPTKKWSSFQDEIKFFSLSRSRSLSISKELELASNSSAHFHTQQYCFKLQGCDNIVLVIWNIPTDSCGAHYVLPIRKVIIARKMAQISLPFVMQTKAYFVHEPAHGCLFALFLSLRLFLLMLPSSFLLRTCSVVRYLTPSLSFASKRKKKSLTIAISRACLITQFLDAVKTSVPALFGCASKCDLRNALRKKWNFMPKQR